jgi:hypothetical protein
MRRSFRLLGRSLEGPRRSGHIEDNQWRTLVGGEQAQPCLITFLFPVLVLQAVNTGPFPRRGALPALAFWGPPMPRALCTSQESSANASS